MKNYPQLRWYVIIFATFIGLSLFVYGMWLQPKKGIISPGPLANHHAHLECKDCHQPLQNYLWEQVLKPATLKCDSCHDIVHSENPHGFETGKSPRSTIFRGWGTVKSLPLTCDNCHTEHHGDQNRDKSQCQACHFVSDFSKTHPTINKSVAMVDAIHFDHQSHFSKHFDENERTCTDCHELSMQGKMKRATYEKGCASCHKDVIKQGQSRGIPLFTLPAIPKNLSQQFKYYHEDNEAMLMPWVAILLEIENKERDWLKRDDENLIQDIEKLNHFLALWLKDESHLVNAIKKVASKKPENIENFSWPSKALLKSWLNHEEDASQESWGATGGWYLAERTLYYAPKGHADPLFSWLYEVSFKNPKLTELWESITDEDNPGGCTYCHEVKYRDTLSWKTERRSLMGDLTKFSHLPHLLGDVNCNNCHQIREGDKITKTGLTVLGFEPIDQNRCATCHEKTGQECLLCHKYHIPENKGQKEKH